MLTGLEFANEKYIKIFLKGTGPERVSEDSKSMYLEFVAPESTFSLLRDHWHEICLLSQSLKPAPSAGEVRKWIENHGPCHVLVFLQGIPISIFTTVMHKTSAEIHGIMRNDLGEIFPDHKQIKKAIQQDLLDRLFALDHIDKVFFRAPPDNKGARGFGLMYGFRPLRNTDKGRKVWVLKRKDYMKRRG